MLRAKPRLDSDSSSRPISPLTRSLQAFIRIGNEGAPPENEYRDANEVSKLYLGGWLREQFQDLWNVGTPIRGAGVTCAKDEERWAISNCFQFGVQPLKQKQILRKLDQFMYSCSVIFSDFVKPRELDQDVIMHWT